MVVCVHTSILVDGKPQIIRVEVSSQVGLPGIRIIGLPSRSITEAKERIITAVRQCGIRLKATKVVINLAPVSLAKTDSGIEFAMAVGLLASMGSIPVPSNEALFIGELSLSGEVQPVMGLSQRLKIPSHLGFHNIFTPDQSDRIIFSSSQAVWIVPTLQDYVAYSLGRKKLVQAVSVRADSNSGIASTVFSEVSLDYPSLRLLLSCIATQTPVLFITQQDTVLQQITSTTAKSLQLEQYLITPITPVRELKAQLLNVPQHTGVLISLHNLAAISLEVQKFVAYWYMERVSQSAAGSKPYLLATTAACACGKSGTLRDICSCTARQKQLYLAGFAPEVQRLFAYTSHLENECVLRASHRAAVVEKQLQAPTAPLPDDFLQIAHAAGAADLTSDRLAQLFALATILAQIDAVAQPTTAHVRELIEAESQHFFSHRR